MHKNGSWAQWQKDIVFDKYPTLRSSEIAPLVSRSESAIDHFASRNGIRKLDSARFSHMSESRKGSGTPNYNGYRRKMSKGYVGIYMPDHPDCGKDGIVMEHRLVAETLLGRRLCCDEVVHHKNGVKDDNRPENLVIMKAGQHSAMHNNERKRAQ